MKNCHAEYTQWKERSIIADCLTWMGFNALAKKALDFSTSREILDTYLSIIESAAKLEQRHDVLDTLYFAGLVNG